MAKKVGRSSIISSLRSVGAIIGNINRREGIGKLRRGDKTRLKDLKRARRRLRQWLRELDKRRER